MSLFYELLRVALGNQETLSKTPSDSEWRSIYRAAQKQTVVGFTFEALGRLHNEGIKPPQDILYEWIGACEQIKNQNILLNRRCAEITQVVSNAGFRSCILKGQGNAVLYPYPLSRTSGDIDIWLEGSKERISDFVKSQYSDAIDKVLHYDYPVFNDVPVEVHYKPQYLSCPKYDKRLQQYFSSIAKEQFCHKVFLQNTNSPVCTPTLEFNVVHQLAHIIGHFFHGGIGMRHLVDYYYVMIALNNTEKSSDFTSLLKCLGLLNFASGLMWVMQETLGLQDKHLIVEPSEQVGYIILNEIDAGGNFGRYKSEKYSLKGKSLFGKAMVFAKRQYRMFSIFPAEAVWQVIDVFIHVVKKYVLKQK